MGMFDAMENKMQEMMNDPQQRAKIEEIAKQKGISMEEAAKEHMMKKNQ